VERNLAGETEVPGENLPQRHFVHHKIPHDFLYTFIVTLFQLHLNVITVTDRSNKPIYF
jgi:hypothetical protein